MTTKNAFSTLLAVLITAVAVGVLVGVITYSYAAPKKNLEIEDLKEQLSKAKEETQVEQGSMSLEASETNNQQPIAETPSNITDETTNWKTYTNDDYGFSFKYPNNLKIKERTEPAAEWIFSVIAENSQGTVQIVVYDKKWLQAEVVNMQKLKKHLININGAKENEMTVKDQNGNQLLVWASYSYFPRNNYVIAHTVSSGKATQDDFWSIDNQILSTFQFTK